MSSLSTLELSTRKHMIPTGDLYLDYGIKDNESPYEMQCNLIVLDLWNYLYQIIEELPLIVLSKPDASEECYDYNAKSAKGVLSAPPRTLHKSQDDLMILVEQLLNLVESMHLFFQEKDHPYQEYPKPIKDAKFGEIWKVAFEYDEETEQFPSYWYSETLYASVYAVLLFVERNNTLQGLNSYFQQRLTTLSTETYSVHHF